MRRKVSYGDREAGTRSSTIGCGECSRATNCWKASSPCCQQVRKTLARICWVRAPFQVRLPPQVLRATTSRRIAASMKLLVAGSPGQYEREQLGLLVLQVARETLIGGMVQSPTTGPAEPASGPW